MKALLTFVVLLAALLISDTAMNQEFTVAENLRHQRVLLPPATPDRSQMAVMDSVMFLEEGGGAGILVYYDNLTTKWDVDYIEFYDIEGNLLLVSWIDRFGICQVAMDRGLLDPAGASVDGMLVTIKMGTML